MQIPLAQGGMRQKNELHRSYDSNKISRKMDYTFRFIQILLIYFDPYKMN